MFVAVARIPSAPAALQRVAAITGLALADVSRALAGTLPRILLRAAPAGRRIAEELEAAGFIAFAGEEAEVLTDKQRILPRTLELSAEGLLAVDAGGQRHGCPRGAMEAFLRGIRLVETSEVTKTVTRKLDLGKALLTSGLSVTKKVETTSERTTSEKESFLLIQRRDGLPDLLIRERRLSYQCLGPAIQPSTFGNFTALVARLQSIAPSAPLDDRITRPGFMTGLPLMAVDPVDLAVFLVGKARLRGC
jgi:hypothetical protein